MDGNNVDYEIVVVEGVGKEWSGSKRISRQWEQARKKCIARECIEAETFM